MSRSHRMSVKGQERRARFSSRSGLAVHSCSSCGKRSYGSKKAAKAVISRVHKGERMNVYHCPLSGDIHVGHIAPGVRSGLLTRSERYGT